MNLNFEKGDGLVPAIIQDWSTGNVLMLGYMNEEALEKTQAEGKVTFYSRTKKRLWTKGETSGNFLMVKDMISDCDQDTLLIKAQPMGPTCHTGSDTCFNEQNQPNARFLHYLQDIIVERKNSSADKSYTKSLFDKGINKIAQKVGEEAVEIVIEAKDSNDHLFKNEAADLLFHLLVLLEAKNVKLEEVIQVLAGRHK
ncbi:MAG: bifunctional phosphoribosyl-AMP cyclohydrolase/phosphoribosyl-ATP diphosphatase HisIE [Cyclobacteriaceae bacterium]|nr:bifunctional phosphoribosyl-AMP cyclohydrolase/phosphoribosyl-ATP diphosphatase HisIE [Cyclobacteriaceae bacterium]